VESCPTTSAEFTVTFSRPDDAADDTRRPST
jgi:hypothetical protein